MFHFSNNNRDDLIPESVLSSLDVILVLGGGVPNSPSSPPKYVKIRCDAAATIFQASIKAKQRQNNNNCIAPSIICLSAGTAHLPQLLSSDGLPIWESTASAAYIIEQNNYIIPPEKVFVETTSYDTISNAFYTRTSFTDITGWRNLLIVTNEFHMNRTKAIFDWIFHASDKTRDDSSPYILHYISCPNVSLSDEAIHIRKLHEAKGEQNVRDNLSIKYPSLQEVWIFLTHEHDFYTASKLARRAANASSETASSSNDKRLKDSYGG